MYPKLVALDTDWTIFWGWLDAKTWGKGRYAYSPIEDNIIKINHWEIQDRTNCSKKCGMYADIPRIISDILKNGAKLAIVSRNRSKEMCDRALWHWTVKDAYGNERRLIELVSYDEVYDQDKTEHFRNIKRYSSFDYSDMILFDHEATSNIVEMMLGVTFQVSRNQRGLTWDNYQAGLAMWRRNKAIHSPWRGIDPELYPKKRLLGYSGMDIETIRLLEKGGRRHDREEAARWGYAMYIADDPTVAKYFNDWIKATTEGFSQTVVCAVFARDGDLWDRLPKIWVPEIDHLKTNNTNGTPFDIAWSQENRDDLIASWGVQKPYILFSRHHNMGNHAGLTFPVPGNQRFNEMVVYPQIQEALIIIYRMTDKQVAYAIETGANLHYEQRVSAWNIAVPPETAKDFRDHNEKFS